MYLRFLPSVVQRQVRLKSDKKKLAGNFSSLNLQILKSGRISINPSLKPIMQTNQQDEQEEDDCCICNESLPKLALNFVRMTCCGKGLHYKCNDAIGLSSMSLEQKNRCPLCRQKRSDIKTQMRFFHFKSFVVVVCIFFWLSSFSLSHSLDL